MSTSSYIVAGLSILPMILAIIGNTVFLITLLKTSSLHTPSNVLLGALCITDLLVGLIGQPLYIAIILGESPVPCCPPHVKAFNFMYSLSCLTSFVFILLITLDRYAAICYPYRYLVHANCRKPVCITFGTFLISLAHAMALVTVYGDFADKLLPIDVGVHLLVIISVLIMYARIYKVVLSQQNRVASIEDSQQSRISPTERSRTHTVTIILAAFIASYVPQIACDVNFLLFYRGQMVHALMFGDWPVYFVLLTSCLNPIIYCVRSQEIRNAARKIFVPRLRFGRNSMTVAANVEQSSERRMNKRDI